MESLKSMLSAAGDKKQQQKRRPLTAYHHHVISSILPDVELQFSRMQTRNKNLEKENEALKKRLQDVTTDGEHLKAEQQRLCGVSKNRDQLRAQLVQCNNELLVLGKKMKIQNTELRREHQQNEVLKKEVESLKKELQSARQQVTSQRAEQQNLKEQLEQVVKERDGLNEKWLRCRLESSELQCKISIQQSNLNKREGRCTEQTRQIHVLRLVNEKLEKERDFLIKEAEEKKRQLRKREEELDAQKEKLRESLTCRCVENQMVKTAVSPKPKPPAVKKASQDVLFQRVEFLQRQLIAQTSELTKTQKLCEELKQNMTQVSSRFQQCRMTARKQKEKLRAVMGERNAYRSDNEKIRKESAAAKKEKLKEKLKNFMARKPKKVKSSGAKSSQALSSKKSNQPAISREVRVDPKLIIRGIKV